MRKGKPRHVPMFLRGENKKIFFTFFSYFMSKNELDIIFQHYDIGLIVLTKIHNIRKKYEDEKNSMQKDENKLDDEDVESFEQKVRTFFLNYKMDPPHGQNEDIQKKNNNSHKNDGRNVINEQTDRENSNKTDVWRSNSFRSIAKTEDTKREGDNNGLHSVAERAPESFHHSDNHSLLQDARQRTPENADINITPQINPHEIICNDVTNRSTLKLEGTINNHEMCRRNIKLKLEKCQGEIAPSVSEYQEQVDNNTRTSCHNTLSSNDNPSLKIKNLNHENHNLIETEKRNAQEIANLIKIEASGEEKDKVQMRTGQWGQNIQAQQRLQQDKQTQESKNAERKKESTGGKQRVSVEVKREIVRNEADVGEDSNGEQLNGASKHHKGEKIKPRGEPDDTIFPARKKNETYKKFSKRINRKKINEFVDYPDEHCFYITDLCKKGTMLSLKRNQLTNQHRDKYKFSFYPKFTNPLGTNQYLPLSRQVPPLNNMRMKLNLFKQLNQKTFTPGTLNELGHPQNSNEKRLSNACASFNEYYILHSCYTEDENHLSNHTYTLDNVESVIYNTCDCTSFMNLQNVVCDLNGVDIPLEGRNAGNQSETRVLSFNSMQGDNEKGVVAQKGEACKGDIAATNGRGDHSATTKSRSDSCEILKKDQHDFQNKKARQGGENIAKGKFSDGQKHGEETEQQINPVNHLTDLVKREPTLPTNDHHHEMHIEGDCILCSIDPNGVATPEQRNEQLLTMNAHLEDNIASSNSHPNSTYPPYSPFPFNSNFQGNPMINNHLSSNNVENYFTNADSTNYRIINMSFNPNSSIATNVYNNPVTNLPNNSMYPMNSNIYILNSKSINILSDGNILTDNPLPNCNLNDNCFKNDLPHARKSFSHNNYYHHLNPYYMFKYNNDPAMTNHNYHTNGYARMNNRSSTYTTGGIDNRIHIFADRQYINMFPKNCTKRSSSDRNPSNQGTSSQICNHNLTPYMCNQNEHLNHQTNSTNSLFHTNQYSENHIGSTLHRDKEEGNSQNVSAANPNELLNMSYKDNVNLWGTSIPGESFHNTRPINVENQPTPFDNILIDVQNTHEQHVKKMQSLLTDSSSGQICSFKDELSVGNENGDRVPEAEKSSSENHVKGKNMITHGESHNNNEEATQVDPNNHPLHTETNYPHIRIANSEEAHQSEVSHYAWSNKSHVGENKELGIAGDVICVANVRADFPHDNETLRRYRNTPKWEKHEQADLNWMTMGKVSRQGIDLDDIPNHVFRPDSQQQTQQRYLPHAEDPHFSENAQHKHVNEKSSIFPSALNQGNSPKSQSPISPLYTYEQNDAGNGTKTHSSNSEVIMYPSQYYVNYFPDPIKSEPRFDVPNVYNQMSEENNGAPNYHVEKNNYPSHINKTDEVVLLSTPEGKFAYTNEPAPWLQLHKKDEPNDAHFFNSNEQRNDTNYALNHVNYFPWQNEYYNKEDKNNRVNEINKMLVRNSENYVLTKQENYRNATHNTVHFEPQGMNNGTPSMENYELVDCMMDRNVNMDIIRNQLNNNGRSTPNGKLGKSVAMNAINRTNEMNDVNTINRINEINALNAINTMNTVNTIKNVNNMNIYTNSLIDKRINQNEFPPEHFHYPQSHNLIVDNYFVDSHFNTPQHLHYYTEDQVMPTNPPHMNAHYTQNKFCSLQNNDHFEPSNMETVQHTQHDNYHNMINTNGENIRMVDPYRVMETKNDVHHTYMPYHFNYYNEGLNTNSSCYGGNVDNMNTFNDDEINVSYNHSYLTQQNMHNHYDNANERNLYEQGVLNQFKNTHRENPCPFYNPLSTYAEGSVTKHGLAFRHINQSDNMHSHRGNAQNVGQIHDNPSRNRDGFDQNSEAKTDGTNNNASAGSSIRNENNITNSNNNEGDTSIRTHTFFNHATNNLYSQANMDTTQNHSENDTAYSHTPGSDNINKINEKYHSSQIETNNNLYGSIESDVTKSNSLSNFLQSEHNDHYEMISSLTPRESPNWYINATNNKRHMTNFNSNATAEMVSFNNTADVYNVQTTDDITNVFSNNLEQINWDHFLHRTNHTHHDTTVCNFHHNGSGQDSEVSTIHIQNLPTYNNLASLNDILPNSLTSGMTNQTNSSSCCTNGVTNYNQCSTCKSIPVTNLTLGKMKNASIGKDSCPSDVLIFSNRTHAHTSDDNGTDKRLNQLCGDPTSENSLAMVKQENEFSTDRDTNGDEQKDADPYGPQNNQLQQILSHLNPYNESYNVMQPINYGPHFLNEQNYHPYVPPHNFNLMNGHDENSDASSKNTFFCINKGPMSEQTNSTITYDMTNEVNPFLSNTKKSDYNTNFYNIHNGVEVKKEIFSNDLEDTTTVDSYHNGYHLTCDPNGDKRNTPMNHNNHIGSPNLRMLNSCQNTYNDTSNELLNYKHQLCNNINDVNALGNNLMNAIGLSKTCTLTDNLYGMPNLRQQKGESGTPSSYPINEESNNTEGNNPIATTCMNDINKWITPKEERMEHVNSLLPCTSRNNNPNDTNKLSSFFGNTVVSRNCLHNKNQFLQQQSALYNILGNGGSVLGKEIVDYDQMNFNCMRNNNYNTYMYLFYLYKQMEGRNHIDSKHAAEGENDASGSIHIRKNLMNMDKMPTPLCNSSIPNGTNAKCEKYANDGPQNSQRTGTQQNANQDSITHYTETQNTINNRPLDADSGRNVSIEMDSYIGNYQNQLNSINNVRDNLLNANVYDVGVLNKNYPPNYPLHILNCNTVSSNMVSSNTLSNNSLCLNVLDSVHPVQYTNYSTQHLTQKNKLPINDERKDHIGSNINLSSNQLKNLLHRDHRTQNSANPLHIPLINYYNMQLLLNYVREKQMYNSMNQDTAQGATDMSVKKCDGGHVTTKMNGIANSNGNDYDSKNSGDSKSTPKEGAKVGGKTNAKGGNTKNLRKHSYSISSVGFSNRSKRWTICPSYVCCNSALCRFKLTCNFKFLQFNQDYNTFNTPCAVYNCYKNIMNKHNYFTSTLCPQQTYLSKHSAQEHETIFNVYWHLLNKEKYQYIQNIILFLDSNLYTRAVWLLKKGYSMDDFQVQKAERKLIKLMLLVFKFTHDYKNDSDKYEHIKSFLYSLKSSHINFELMNRFLFY
ncbi:hypothetical protein AK88_05057 [Plasmodium fragile]|uniref:Sporozoite and liver stage asparagine-rich protein n=1 Tax=Plasmodium fragile TaxID=5857 RepID=A0A0D9QE75_PLAFR|nr:uncharacterized protein AK88_05057 [Plasmodium fragile]KJP85303.1 hypothetical protein AK88_05057 [Plasmodium fragile]